MALDVRETYLRDCSVHSYFSRVLLDALSVPPLGQVLGGFWEANIVDFRNFPKKNGSKKQEHVWKAKTSHFEAKKRIQP